MTSDVPGSSNSRPSIETCPVDVFQRIAASIEKDRQRGRLELVIAVVLSMATLASTWCGYQARLWGSVASASSTAADTLARSAAENMIIGLQLRTQDGLMLIECWRALRANDEITRDTIFAHLRPQLRQAVEASIAEGALVNPAVQGPMQRPEYVLAEEQEARRQREEAVGLRTSSREAASNADAYVLITMMFASVLFFGGIAGTFRVRRVGRVLAAAAIVLFAIAATMMLALPVCGK